MSSTEIGQARANSWCLVSRHRAGQPLELLFGDAGAVLGLPAAELSESSWEAAIVGGRPNPCAWVEPCESSLYLLSTSGQPATWMESSSVATDGGGLVVSTRAVTLGSSEELLAVARLSLGGSLLGPMAHEINNYVQGLSAAEYLFRDYIECGDQIEIEDIDRLGEAVSNLKDLGAHIQGFSRIAVAPVEALSLADIVKRATGLLTSVGRMGLVEFDDDVAEGLPTLHWPLAELDFVILALVANAVDASLEDAGESKVSLMAVATDTGIHLELRNSGSTLNLNADSKPGASSKPANRHLGLGLSVAMAMIRRRGGSVEALTGEGSGLQLTLPLQATEASA